MPWTDPPPDSITLDGDALITPYSLVCTFCAHLRDSELRTCDAFPNGIPREIWLEENDHRKPYLGDNGIQFEQRRPPAHAE